MIFRYTHVRPRGGFPWRVFSWLTAKVKYFLYYSPGSWPPGLCLHTSITSARDLRSKLRSLTAAQTRCQDRSGLFENNISPRPLHHPPPLPQWPPPHRHLFILLLSLHPGPHGPASSLSWGQDRTSSSTLRLPLWDNGRAKSCVCRGVCVRVRPSMPVYSQPQPRIGYYYLLLPCVYCSCFCTLNVGTFSVK